MQPEPEQKSLVACANCGGVGHVYKQCNHPITSFGVICFRIAFNHESNTYMPQYLMVQRKDSLSYVEFMRGKYNCDQRDYLLKLFSNMTTIERKRVLTTDFDSLWKQLWQIQDCNSFVREYTESKSKFNMLKRGYHLKNAADQSCVLVSLEYLVNNSNSELPCAEWGFPKGRRNINEDDITCAFREFKEETGLSANDVNYLQEFKPYEEIFSGSNHVRYRHIYYIAFSNINDVSTRVNPNNKIQCKEVKDINWFWYHDAQSMIREYNIERKELFKRVHTGITKFISSLSNMYHVGSTRKTKNKEASYNKVKPKGNY
jgi:ADP-ribose pyrophosphatase YjhB (NUDIX family)